MGVTYSYIGLMVVNFIDLYIKRGSRIDEYDSLLKNKELRYYQFYVMSHPMTYMWIVLSGIQLKQDFVGFVKIWEQLLMD